MLKFLSKGLLFSIIDIYFEFSVLFGIYAGTETEYLVCTYVYKRLVQSDLF